MRKLVKIINPSKDKRWGEFVKNHPEGTVFHLSNWAEVMIKTYNFKPYYFVFEDESGNIKGGLPFFLVDNGIYGKKLISVPFTDCVNPLISSEKDYQEFFEKILELYKTEKCKYIEIRGKIENKNVSGLKREEYFKNFILDLHEKTESDIWDSLHDSVKRGIKKAQKYELKTVISHNLSAVNIFYNMNVITRKKQGVFPQPYKFFFNLWQYIIQRKMGFAMLAILDDTPISSAIFLYYNGTIFYKYGASYTEYLNYRPNNLIFWEAIKWAKEHNYKYLDLGRTSPDNEGLMKFKRHWGAEEVDLPYYYYPEVKGVSSVKQSSLKYKITTSILRRTPTRILVATSNKFYKYFA